MVLAVYDSSDGETIVRWKILTGKRAKKEHV